jgi:hypothetical protein
LWRTVFKQHLTESAPKWSLCYTKCRGGGDTAVSMVGKYKQQVFDVGVIACGRVSIQRGVLPVRVTASDSSLIVPLSR